MNKQTNKNLTGVQSLRQYYYSLQITLILFLYLITMLLVTSAIQIRKVVYY